MTEEQDLRAASDFTWSDLDEQLVKLVSRARDVRQGVREGLYGPDQGPEALHAHLVAHRRALDLLEAYLAELGNIRAGLELRVAAAQAAIEDAETDAVVEGSPWSQEFMSAQERNARLRGESLEQRVQQRREERRLAEVRMAHEYVRVLHRGLEGSRNDLVQRIKLVTLTSALERG